MATGTYAPFIPQQYFDNNGAPLASGTITTQIAGTSTPIATYSDVSLVTQNANPIPLNSAGRPTSGAIFLTPGASYKFIIKDSTGSTLATYDNIASIPGSSSGEDITGIAGEALTAGQAVYLSDGSGGKVAGSWYKADSANTYSSTFNDLGMVPASITSGGSGTIRLGGQVTGLTSLTIGALYFVGTAGAITTTAPTNRRFVGQADTTSSLILAPPSFYQNIGALTNGQLIVGSTGATPVLATLTAGVGIQVTNAAGAITIANGVIDRVVTATTISNTTAETGLYSFSVPGNTLSTNRTLHFRLLGDYLQNSGASDKVYTIRVKYGATTMLTYTINALTTTATRGSFILDVELTAENATNVQRAGGLLQFDSANGAGSPSITIGTTASYTTSGVSAAAAEDSTAAKTLAITGQMSFNAATMEIKLISAYTEVK